MLPYLMTCWSVQENHEVSSAMTIELGLDSVTLSMVSLAQLGLH